MPVRAYHLPDTVTDAYQWARECSDSHSKTVPGFKQPDAHGTGVEHMSASFQMRARGKRIEQLRARRTLTGGEPAGQRSPAQIQSRIWSKRVLMAECGANVCSRHGDWRYLETGQRSMRVNIIT